MPHPKVALSRVYPGKLGSTQIRGEERSIEPVTLLWFYIFFIKVWFWGLDIYIRHEETRTLINGCALGTGEFGSMINVESICLFPSIKWIAYAKLVTKKNFRRNK